MTHESLARRFRPAGFEQPEGSRHNYAKPSPELQEAFYKWIENLPGKFGRFLPEYEYRRAVESVKDIDATPEEVNSLLLVDYGSEFGEKVCRTGLFVSVIYNKSGRKYIVFDLDAENIDFIGYGFDGVLANIGSVGKYFGHSTKGIAVNNREVGYSFACLSESVAINNGKAENTFGYKSKSFVINNGEALDDFAYDSNGPIINNGKVRWRFGGEVGGPLIAIKEPGTYGWDLSYKRKVLGPEDCRKIPDLKKYLSRLKRLTKSIKDDESAKKFLEMYGPEPKESIERDIKEIIRKGGFEV